MYKTKTAKTAVKRAEKRLGKDVIQCQSCLKSSLDGVTLSKCGQCGVVFYCSKECQKEAWPRHRLSCKLLQPPEVKDHPDILKAINDLRAFTAKVRPTLMLWGIPAFNLKEDIKRGERDVLIIALRKRPDAKRPELAYICVEACLKAVDSFPGPHKQYARAHVDNCQKDAIASGALGGVVMVLIDLDMVGILNAVPFAFDASHFVGRPQPGPGWRAILMHHLNNGKPLGSNLL